jgi:FkbM family methyltransferase
MAKFSLAKLRRACRMPLYYRNWVGALLNRLGPPAGDRAVTYVFRSGAALSMKGGSHDVRVLNEVWLDRIYEPSPDFRVRQGWTVLDLGGHKGAFTVRAALAGPTTRVHVLEPEPENLRYLRANLVLNRLANVVVHAGAVSTSSGEALLYLSDHGGSGTNSLFQEQVEGRKVRTLSVPTIRLDDLLDRAGGQVDLMKMDVEGAEYAVLHAVSPEGLRRIRRIVLEYHAVAGLDAQAVGDDLRQYLQGNGFECAVAEDRCVLFARRRGYEAETVSRTP